MVDISNRTLELKNINKEYVKLHLFLYCISFHVPSNNPSYLYSACIYMCIYSTMDLEFSSDYKQVYVIFNQVKIGTVENSLMSDIDINNNIN